MRIAWLYVKWMSYDKMNTPFFFYKNHAYKNVEAQITPKTKNIVVILLVAISISSQPQMKFRRSYKKTSSYTRILFYKNV